MLVRADRVKSMQYPDIEIEIGLTGDEAQELYRVINIETVNLSGLGVLPELITKIGHSLFRKGFRSNDNLEPEI